ncbi:hypothetical protein B0A52_06881 [Exophiala mesophila]|uniref:Zn(2)-C6 fungal-type domain-containing protein n=1 Tax=Exophiala mesophila TaxID=212818 RepID=A0A438N0N8_EXOME|nr:hypothetical protein B0A52_06881 [Exophiala mesophila]
MPPRRSHAKSRRGCINCKSRHIKCDEGGPPCERCKLRGTPCEYTSSGPIPKISSPAEVQKGAALDAVSSSVNQVRLPADRRLLELQLMHRWSTGTYKSCVTPQVNDGELWQQKVPALAVQYDFLLNGLLALSAYDCAGSTIEAESEQYANSAVEYHALALGSFRSYVPRIDSDSHEAAFACSLILMILAIASAQFASKPGVGNSHDMVQDAIVHFEMLRGCVPILNLNADLLLSNPQIQKLVPWEDLPRTMVDGPTRTALGHLSDFNDKKIVAARDKPGEYNISQIAHWETCKKAISMLTECFEKCVDDLSRGYALGWLNFAGEDYIKALKDEDSAALLALMFWGVLVDKLGHQVWWAEKFGSLLVSEVSNRVLAVNDDKETQSMISWALGNISSDHQEQI